MKHLFLCMLTTLALILANAAGAAAADGTEAISRAYDAPFDEFIFQSPGGQILFATLEADIYQSQGRGAGEQALAAATGEGGGGCSEEAPPGGFCLQVLDQTGTVLCWADRPVRPGWQRDPRLACVLPEDGPIGTYALRVVYQEGESSCGPEPTQSASGAGDGLFYLINLGLRKSVQEGSIRIAIGQSGNRL